MTKRSLEEIWRIVLAQIEVKIDSSANFKTWFVGTSLVEINDKKANIGVKNSYTADWLTKKHLDLIQETVSHVTGSDLEIVFSIDNNLINTNDVKEEKKDTTSQPIFQLEGGESIQLKNAIKISGLNPKYTFKNFIVGDSNNIAHAASIGVSENPGKIYNPLFIHGHTGLGKTHLAQAVGLTMLDKDPSTKIAYVSSEAFLNDMINSIKTGRNVEFRRRFRTVDLLIIDDIQLISKWPKTQIEFFNTFNSLYNDQKQIILTSDVSPDRLNDIDDRLKSRFQGGIVVEVYKPDLETRLAIINNKINVMGLGLPNRIIEFIAKEISDNIRELEGSIQKISLYNSMVNYELSNEEVAKILGRDIQSKRQKIKIPDILKKVAKEFEVTVKDIKGPRRTATIAFARQVAMYILRKEFKYKLEKIASILNRKDHTTVIHAVDKIESKLLINEGFKEQINMLIEEMKANNL